jgi:hypothetical protein
MRALLFGVLVMVALFAYNIWLIENSCYHHRCTVDIDYHTDTGR